MATLKIPQNSFSSGIIDEDRVRDRYDLKQYENGARELHNVNTHPQGGAYRRPGTIWMSRYTEKGTKFKFARFDYSDDIEYMLVFYEDKIDVWRDHALVHTITATGITAVQATQMDFVQRANALIIAHGDFMPKQLSRGANDVTWTLISAPFAPLPLFGFNLTSVNPAATATPSAISGNIKITASASAFLASDVGGYITGNGGEARITSYVSPTVVTARVTLTFVDTTAIPSGQWTLERGYEAAWSNTRKYPRTVAYHNDALILGGTRSLPDVFWKSAIGEYLNFDESRAQSTSALSSNVKADSINDIRAIVSGNDLIILTSEAEFYVSGNLTPDLNFEIRKQEERGCRAYIKPVFVDGAPIYIDARADVLRELTYSDVDAKYSSTNLSLFSSGLIKDPVGLAHQRPQGTRDNDYVWIINGDGTWVTFNTLRKQSISAFSTGSSRSDKLITAADLSGSLYAMFERNIDGNTEYYLERFTLDVKMDCCMVYSGAAVSTVTGLEFLEGETVKVITNGHIYGEATVEAGQVVLDKAYTDITIGLPFKPRIVTLPPSTQLPDGTSIGQIRRIAAVSVGMSETGKITVNGQPVRTRRFGQPVFNVPPPLISGRERVTLRGGYNRDPVIVIEQEEPEGFHITGLVLEVQV